jgi:hypothetical protein
MATKLELTIIFIGAVLGWLLFLYTAIQIIITRKREIQIIQKIKSDFELLKSDISKITVDIKK